MSVLLIITNNKQLVNEAVYDSAHCLFSSFNYFLNLTILTAGKHIIGWY